MIELSDSRDHAMASPEVEERSHFRLPGFRVAAQLWPIWSGATCTRSFVSGRKRPRHRLISRTSTR